LWLNLLSNAPVTGKKAAGFITTLNTPIAMTHDGKRILLFGGRLWDRTRPLKNEHVAKVSGCPAGIPLQPPKSSIFKSPFFIDKTGFCIILFH
jgi:hypothetical protein